MRVLDLADKGAVLAENPNGSFTIPHFDRYPAVLVRLDLVASTALREALLDGWLACASTAGWPARRAPSPTGTSRARAYRSSGRTWDVML